MVVQAYILIQTEVGKAATVAEQIASISGVTLAEDVTGPYDVIARVEARNVDELGKLVIAKIQDVPGITRTLTCTVVHVCAALPAVRRRTAALPGRRHAAPSGRRRSSSWPRSARCWVRARPGCRSPSPRVPRRRRARQRPPSGR